MSDTLKAIEGIVKLFVGLAHLFAWIGRTLAAPGLRRGWSRVAEALGLSASDLSLKGTVDGCAVSAEGFQGTSKFGASTTLSVGHPALPQGLKVALDAREPSAVYVPDLEGVTVTGDRATALAFLTAARRRPIRDRLIGGGWSLDAGALRMVRTQVLSGPALETTLRGGIALAPELAFDPSTVNATLAASAEDDPEPALREQNLEALMQRLGHQDPAVVDLARGLCGDPDDAVALLSAAILDDRPSLTGRGMERVEVLDTRGALRLAAVLSRTALDGRDAALLVLAERSEEDVRRFAIEVLGQVGDRTAVMPLLERFDGALRPVADAAVAAIQAREGGEAGALSIVEGGAMTGGLTLAPREGGDAP